MSLRLKFFFLGGEINLQRMRLDGNFPLMEVPKCCAKSKQAGKEAGPYCPAANGCRKKSASRRFLLPTFARRTEMSALLILPAKLNFTRHWWLNGP